MGPMTEITKETSIADFYDALAIDYDVMTGFEKRFEAERPVFRKIVEDYGIKTAVDAGCGTGFHSLLLAQLGVTVTAVDISPTMLENVSLHARKLGLSINTTASTFQSIADRLNQQYDAVFCLGNSLAHTLHDDDLRAALAGFASVTKPEGVLVIQILNYDRILEKRERVQNVRQAGNTTFIRFYDFEKEIIRFNILKLEKKNAGIEHTLNSISLRPWRQSEINTFLTRCGFYDVKSFGSISLNDYNPGSSKDLVIVARKET